MICPPKIVPEIELLRYINIDTETRRAIWANDDKFKKHNYSIDERIELGCDILDESKNPEVVLISREDKPQKDLQLKKLREGMKTLTEKQSRAIQMRFFLRMTLEEIAEEEGVNINAITMRIEYALKKLKKLF